MEVLEILEALNRTHGPSGDEGGVREKIAELARPFADEVITDTLGNLIVRKKGSGPRVMLAAHMDSIGFIVTHIEKEGFLRVAGWGELPPGRRPMSRSGSRTASGGCLFPRRRPTSAS